MLSRFNIRKSAAALLIAALFNFSPSALAGPSGGFPAHHQNKAKPIHIRDVGKGLAKVGRGIGKGIGAVGRGFFEIGKGVVKGGGKVIGGVAGGVAAGGREVVGGVKKAFGRDQAGDTVPEGSGDSAKVEAASVAQKVEQMNQSASSAGEPCVRCEEKARADAAAAGEAAPTAPQGSLPDAVVTLACEDERIEDYLLGMEAFLSARSHATEAEKQALAASAAQLMNATKQNTRKPVPARLGAKASQLLNGQQNWAEGGLVEQSLAATFGEGAGPQMLQQTDLRGLAQVCGTPNRFRKGGPFEQLKLDLAALARQDQNPDPGLLNRTLIYCPRLAFELADASQSFAEDPKFCEAGIAQYLGVKPAAEEPPSTLASKESTPPSEAPASGGQAEPGATPSTEVAGSQAPAAAPGASESAPLARQRPIDQANEALKLSKGVDPNSSEHQPTVDRLQAAKARLERVLADRGNPNRRRKLVQTIDAELARFGVSAAPAQKPAVPAASTSITTVTPPPSAAPAAAKPQVQKPTESEQLLDQVFEQDPITLGDRANTEIADRAAELEKKKALRNLALKPREKVQSSDASGLAQAGQQIASEITRSKAQLPALNDRINQEKNDREKDKLRSDYARVQSKITTLETIKIELAEKKTYADQQVKAEGLLKDFSAHRHFDAWGAGAFNLLDGSDEKTKKDALVKLQSDMQNGQLPSSDQQSAKKKWNEMVVGRQKAIDQSWLNSETKKIVDDLEKADQGALGYYTSSQGAQVNAPINLTPSLEHSKLVLQIYRKQNPGNLYAPSASAVQKILLEAQAAVRAGKVKSVTEYLETP